MTTQIRPVRFDSEIARQLNDDVQAEYVRRYGSPDETVITANEFISPNGGYFLLFDDDDEALGSGAWRAHGESDAEMKRLFIVESSRNRGLARIMVAWLEADAAKCGRSRMVLETGEEQPEALALYHSLGYRPVESFGFYANEAGAHHLGKDLVLDEVLTA